MLLQYRAKIVTNYMQKIQ